jgi:hypothetical protein
VVAGVRTYDLPSNSRSRTFIACSRGLLQPPSSHAEGFLTESSCVVDGASTGPLPCT